MGPEVRASDSLARMEEIRRLCRERWSAITPAERDDLLQLWIAQGMTPTQKLNMTRMLCNAAIALHLQKQSPA